MPLLLEFSLQDWLIVVAFFIIALCVLKIRQLKKTISQAIQKQLLPQLQLEMDKKRMCFYLKNEGFSIVQDIRISDSQVTLDDSGFKINYILQFENRGFLRPKESTDLLCKVMDKDRRFLPEVTERIFVHLITPSFKIELTCSDIEGRRTQFIFSKKGERFYSQRVLNQP